MALDLEVLATHLPPRLLRNQMLGTIQYIWFRDRGVTWGGGGPFNGQIARQALFREIIAKTLAQAIVETGTYLGTTTEFMSQTGLPVFTIESHPRYYGFARARFWRRRNINLIQGDSRTALRRLFDGPLKRLAGLTVFFYLDAHWNDDLPLADEIDLVFSRCPRAVIMIDDFEVPSDPGYEFDDYGPGKALVSGYIRPAILVHQLRTFYPSVPSAAESGARRGCVVLAREGCLRLALGSIPLLRLATEAESKPAC
jgi:hypothetical protein